MPAPGSVDLRIKSVALATAVVGPAAIFLAANVSADSNAEKTPAPIADDPPPSCLDAEDAPPPEPPPESAPMDAVPAANVDIAAHPLPPGIASEQGLQVSTILVSRSISEAFPQIHDMIGVRPDSQPWHPSGRAIDVMIPNSGTSDGVALGDEIIAYTLRNAGRFGLQDAIWRGVRHTPGGPSGAGYGHYDHVHITTVGGGYPSGAEEYLSDEPPPPAPDEQI